MSWDIPVSAVSNAPVSASNVLASGITASEIVPGGGISINSSSTMWRWQSWATTNTNLAAAVVGGDYFEWSVTAGARTSASLTNFAGVQFKNSLTATAVELHASTNNWASSSLVGSITGTGITMADTVNFHTGTQSWFTSPFPIAPGGTARFRFFVRGSSSGTAYIGFNPDLDWTFGGTTAGGPWNLLWNGAGNTVSNGATGLFTGTDAAGQPATNPAFQAGDNVTISQSGVMNIVSNGVTFGAFAANHANGVARILGGNLTAANLLKSEEGTLALAGTNNFAAGLVSGGSILADSAGALGSGGLAFSGGTLLVTNPAVGSLGAALEIGAGGMSVEHAADLALSGAITGSNNVLTKKGAGSLTLTGLLGANKAGVMLTMTNGGSLLLSGAAKELGGANVWNGIVTATNVTINLSQNSSVAGSGPLVVNGGTVATVFGSTGGSATITKDTEFQNAVSLVAASGKTLRFESGLISGSGSLFASGSGAMQFLSTGASTFDGAITFSGAGGLTLAAQMAANLGSIALASTNAVPPALVLSNSGANTGTKIPAEITGNGSVRKAGNGAIVMEGVNTFSGGLVLDSSGAWLVNNAQGLGTGPITSSNASGTIGLVADGDAEITVTNPVVVAQLISTNTNTLVVTTNLHGAVFAPGAGRAIAVAGPVSGPGQLKVAGGGDVSVTGASNTYAGGTEIGTGRLVAATAGALGSGPVNFGSASNSCLAASAPLTLARHMTIGSSSAAGYTAHIDSGAHVFQISGVIADRPGNARGGSLAKLGEGTLVLSATNTYSGGTLVAAGDLTVSASSLPGQVTNNASLTFVQSANGSFTNQISGGGVVCKLGAGTLTLAASNSYGAGTSVQQGTLRAGNAAAFGTGTVTIGTGAVLDLALLDIANPIVNNGGTIINSTGLSGVSFTAGTSDVTQNNSSIVEISGTATVYLSGVNAAIASMLGGTLNVNAGGTVITNYAAGSIAIGTGHTLAIQSGSGSGVITGEGGLLKTGSGLLQLTSSNSYTGPTTISAGMLELTGSIDGSAVSVGNSGILSGTGTAGALTVGNGGTIAPGGVPGELRVTGNLKLNPSGNYNWQVRDAGGAAGAGYDHLAVSGALDLTGLSITNRFIINLATLAGAGAGETAGLASNFDKTQTRVWTLVTAGDGFAGNLNPAHFTINTGAANGTSGFLNDFFGGSFSLAQDGNSLLLVYSPAAIGNTGAGPISITNAAGAPNSVAPGQWYVQSFNDGALPATGSAAWTNNETLPGWYAAIGANPTNNYTNIIAAFPSPTSNVSGQLYSVPQHFDNNTPDSAYRAIAVAPSGTSGPNHLALRFVNNTTNTITGFSVSYEMRWGYSQLGEVDSFNVIAGGSGYSANAPPDVVVTGSTTASNAGGTAAVNASGNVTGITRTNSGSGYVAAPVVSVTNGTTGTNTATARAVMRLVSSSNSVTLSHRVFAPGTGTLANFSANNWATVTAVSNRNTTSSAVPDNWNYVVANVTNVSLAPGQEIWLNWQVAKLGSTGSSLAAIDNVRVGGFARGNPAIMTQPMPQTVIMGNSATLSVTASGNGLTYQWRKNGTNIGGATGSSLTLAAAQPSDVGSHDVVVTGTAGTVVSEAVPVQVYTRAAVRGAATSSVLQAPAASGYTHEPSYFDIAVTNNAAYVNTYDLYVPDVPAPASGRPAVLVIHGGGGNDGDKADGREVQAAQEFASRGYVALSINYKRSFKTRSNGNWTAAWPQNIKDAKTAVRWLRANAATYGIDPARIGAIGFSWGGNEAAMLALTDGDPTLDPSSEDGLGFFSTAVACGANFYGAVQIPDYHNMNQFAGTGVPGTPGTMDFIAGPNNYLAASPASRATRQAAPMLLHFGDADLEVMPTQNEALRAALDNAGAPTVHVIIPGGKHSYSLYETDTVQGGSVANPIDVRAYTLGFYDQYLLPRIPLMTSAAAVSAIKSGAVSHQVTANNGATLFSMTGQTSNLSIDPSTGLITGTMPSSGSRAVTVYATGVYGTAVQTLTFTAVEGLTISNTAAGTTPQAIGYNLGHFTDNGNALDWFRYSGVRAARVFISASEIQSQTSPARSSITSESTFWSTVQAARNNGPAKSTQIRWSDFHYDYTSTSGSNVQSYEYLFTALSGLGVDILANITASPGTFPISGAGDWAGKWELWQHFYAQAYVLARDHDISRFGMFNEPNNWVGMTPSDWLARLRICSDAIQKAIADVNAARSKNLVAQLYAPNTANGKEKYNDGTDTWGRDTIVNRFLQLDGTSAATWTPRATAVPWLLAHIYNYQKYSLLTHDSGGSSGYVNDILALRSFIDADNGAEPVPPMALTEYNVRTGASYDTRTENQDTPGDYIALGANSVALAENGANELFLFKFGQTASVGVNYGVARNGTHYVQNGESTANNYGGATKAAEVFRLFNKAAQGGRPRLALAATGGASSSTTAGLWSLASRDEAGGLLRVFLANKNASAVPLALNLASLGVPNGAPVFVEEVGENSSGGGRFAGNVAGGQIGLQAIPPATAWLVTVPITASGLFAITADADAELADGANRNLPNGAPAQMLVRADGTANGRRAALIRIPVTAEEVAAGRAFYLDLQVAASDGTAPVQAHVYGVSNDVWEENSATWASSPFLRQNVGSGGQIASNVALNAGANGPCRMLGAIVANSTTPSRTCVDVTGFVQTQADGYATFLILQDHRWDFSADTVATRTTGDIQPAGLVVTARENAGGAPRLLALSGDAFTAPPTVLTSPADQYLNAGESVTLSVSADQSLPVTYQWLKNGEIIAGANGSTLMLANVTAADADIYTMEVTSANGTTTSAGGIVGINSSPVLFTALANVSANTGDPVTLAAVFTGSPPPSYVWRRNNAVIPGATAFAYSFIASESTAGVYSVTAINASGSAASSATVAVTAAPTGVITLSSLAGSVTENFNSLGKSRSFAIGTSSYYGWTNGSGWVNGDGFTNKPGWYATTDDNRSPFEGYRVVNDGSGDVDNVPSRAKTGLAGMGTSSSDIDRALGGIAWTNNRVVFGARIRNATTNAIQSCTVIYTLEQYSSASTNRNGTRLIAATAANVASLRSPGWTGFATNAQVVSRSGNNSYGGINGNSSGNNRRYTNVVSGLAVGPGDSLWIRWELSTTNAFPLAFAIDDLVVTNFVAATAPVISAHPASRTNVSGEAASFSVTATGAPLPSFQWLKGTNVIEGATNPTLTISPARAADAGSYSVRVANVAGTKTSTVATLTISPRPAAVLQPPVASAITYGQQLSSSILSNGEGSVSGTFSFASPAAIPNGGAGEQVVSFTPLDSANYSAGSATVLVTVDRAVQSIWFAPMPPKALGDPAFAVAASASSGLPLEFSSSNESVAILSGNILTMHGAGSTLIMATQSGDGNYLPANPVEQLFNVSSAAVSFASEFGGAAPTSDSDGDGVYALFEYAFGGSTNRNDWDLLPKLEDAGLGELSIRYLARTNDPSLVFRPVGTKTLAGVWGTNGVVTTVLGTTNIGTNTLQIRRSTLSLSNEPAGFLRLDVGLEP